MEHTTPASQQKHISVGVIGLGIIGRAIATHLRKKGFSVFVWSRSPRPIPNFVGSLGELASLCNYIQIFVSDDDALLKTAEQLSEKLTPRHVVLAHPTVAPDSMRAAAELVERRGARFVEACFTGSKGAAQKGELVYYVGGTEEALRDARPILEASGKQIVTIGTVGQASTIKIATNMVTAASVQAAAEALALVQAHGLSLEKFIEAMCANASYSGTLAMKLPKMIGRDFEPHFSVKHMLKDMQIANRMALLHYLDLGVTTAASNQLAEQVQWGYGEEDYTAVMRKYLHEPASAFYEEPQIQVSDEQFVTEESSVSSVDAEIPKLEPQEEQSAASVAPLVGSSGPVSATVSGVTPARRGLLKQLLSRFSSVRE